MTQMRDRLRHFVGRRGKRLAATPGGPYRWQAPSARTLSARRLLLPLVTALLALYIAWHSPLRTWIGPGGSGGRGCYLACQPLPASEQVLRSGSALVLLLVAGLTARRFAAMPGLARYERPLVFGVTALSCIVVPAALIGVLGDVLDLPLLQPPLGPLLVALPAGIASMARRRQPVPRPVSFPRPGVLVATVAATAGLLQILSLLISVLHPPTGFDALAYHAPLAVYLWRDGNLGAFLDRAPWAWAMAHPGVAELWFGLLWVLGGERLANLGQLPFALLGATAVYTYARRTRLRHGAALLAACAFLSAPLVVAQAGMQWNDVVAGALAMVAAALACAPREHWTGARLALIGGTLGLASTTKLAVLPFTAAVIVFVAISLLWRGTPQRLPGARLLAITVAAMALVAAAWWIRNGLRYGNPLYPAALPGVGRGVAVGDFGKRDARFVGPPVAWPLYPLIEPLSDQSGYGALFAMGALPGVAVALVRRRSRPVLLYGVLAAMSLPAWWWLTPHDPRLILGLFGLGFAFVPWMLVGLPRGQRRIGTIMLAIAVSFSALVTVDQILLPLARAPIDRDTFYDRIWNIDPVVATLPEDEGLLYHSGYASFSYAGDYALLGPGQGRILVVIDAGATREAVVALMRRERLRYAYVPSAPENRMAVEAIYNAPQFELVRSSAAGKDDLAGTRRYLYRFR